LLTLPTRAYHTYLIGKIVQGEAHLMSELASVESLEFALTRCRKKAVALGSESLVYLLDMAILEIGLISVARRVADSAQNNPPASGPDEETAGSEGEALAT